MLVAKQIAQIQCLRIHSGAAVKTASRSVKDLIPQHGSANGKTIFIVEQANSPTASFLRVICREAQVADRLAVCQSFGPIIGKCLERNLPQGQMAGRLCHLSYGDHCFASLAGVALLAPAPRTNGVLSLSRCCVFGLSDSPVGLAAWIIEKFQRWSDCRGDLEAHIPRDALLDNIMLYWTTGAINSSFWPYHARQHGAPLLPPGAKVTVPVGYAEFPKEILTPPRSVAERSYADIRRWTVMKRGGHFAAMEDPDELCEEIRAFFRPLRAGYAGG